MRDTAALGDEGNQVNEASVSYPKIVVASLAEHPLPELVAAGVRCSVSTDDPAMFGTDLGTEYRTAARLGVPPQVIYQAGVQGALCDEETRAALRRVGEACASATGRGGGPGQVRGPRPPGPVPAPAGLSVAALLHLIYVRDLVSRSNAIRNS